MEVIIGFVMLAQSEGHSFSELCQASPAKHRVPTQEMAIPAATAKIHGI